MRYDIVTSATPEYLPGIVALRNSLRMNFPEATLHCFYYTKGQKKDLPEGINYLIDIPLLGYAEGEGEGFRHGLLLGPDMYIRLHIPLHFTGRVFYVDADCLVHNSLEELWDMDLQGFPTACVYRPDVGWVGGHKHDDMASGTFLCDCEEWNRLSLVQEMYEVMKPENRKNRIRSFHVNVESVMSYVHSGNFLHLPAKYQILTYYNSLIQTDKVSHFAGPKPWNIDKHDRNHLRVNFSELWKAYYFNDTEKVIQETNCLPEGRPKDFIFDQRNRRTRGKDRGKPR